VVGGSAYRELGEKFEDEEHARLRRGGLREDGGRGARLEAAFGIADLASFTP